MTPGREAVIRKCLSYGARYAQDPDMKADHEQALAALDSLLGALRYYAEQRNYGDRHIYSNDSYDETGLPGSRARAALAAAGGQE